MKHDSIIRSRWGLVNSLARSDRSTGYRGLPPAINSIGLLAVCGLLLALICTEGLAKNNGRKPTSKPAVAAPTESKAPDIEKLMEILRQKEQEKAKQRKQDNKTSQLKPKRSTSRPVRPARPSTKVQKIVPKIPAPEPKASAQPEVLATPSDTVDTARTQDTGQPELKLPYMGGPVDPNKREIEFSFDDVEYSVVFKFIERISGMPILGDRKIDGTLTYFSRKKFTLDEALQELNLLLQDKGRVVIRTTSDHLRVAKFPEVLRGDTRDFIGAQQFFSAGVPSVQVVRVIFKVNNLSAQELTTLIAETIPLSEMKLSAWKTTNRIQVVGLAWQVRKVIRLAQKLDTDIESFDPSTPLRRFQLKHVKPSEMKELLLQLLPASQGIGIPEVPSAKSPARRPSPKKSSDAAAGVEAQLIPHDDSDILFVRARPAMLEKIEQLIAQLDIPAARAGPVIIKLKHAKAVQLINNVLKPFYKASNKTLPAAADAASNSVIIWAVGRQLEQLRTLVQEVENAAGQGKVIPSIKIYHLPDADVQQMAAIVQQILGQSKGRSPKPQGAVTVADITISADPSSQSLIVAGPEEKIAKVDQIIKQLQGQFKDTQITTVVDLKHADAAKLAKTVKDALLTRGKDKTAAMLRISAAPSGKAVVVTGSGSMVSKTVELINKLDQPPGDVGKIRTFSLKFAVASETATMIKDLFGRGKKSADFKVTADDWSNNLFVIAQEAIIPSIEQLIKTLDTAEPITDGGSGNVVFIAMNTADAFEVAMQINELLYPKSPKGRQQGPSVEASTFGNYLVVMGAAKDIERVRKLAEQIDALAKQMPEMLAIRYIDKLRAAELAQMLRAIYPRMTDRQVQVESVGIPGQKRAQDKEIESKSPAPPADQAAEFVGVTIGVDDRNNALVIRGTQRDIDQIDNLIKQLMTDIEPDVPFEIFPVKHGDPVEIAATLESVFNQQQAKPAAAAAKKPSPKGKSITPKKTQKKAAPPVTKKRIKAVPAPNINSIIVRANPRDFEPVGLLIEQLDVARTGQVRVYVLKHAEAKEVARVISEMYGTAAAKGKAKTAAQTAQQIRVSAETVSNTVLVWAPQSTWEQISQTIEQMEQQAEAALKIHVLQLAHARATALAKSLKDIFGELTFTADDASKQIMVKAPEHLWQQVQQMARQMDIPEAGGERMFKAFALKYANAPELAQHLTKLGLEHNFKDSGSPADSIPPVIGGDASTNKLMVGAGPKQMALLELIITELDIKPTEAGSQVQPYVLKKANARDVARAISEMYAADPSKAEQIRVSSEPSSNTVLVRAPQALWEQIKQTIEQMETEAAGVSEVYTMELKHAAPSSLAGSLATLFKSHSGVVIIGDDGSKQLMVKASEDIWQKVQQIVAQMDVPAASGDREFKVFQLKYAIASEVALQLAQVSFQSELIRTPTPWWWGGGRRGGQDTSKPTVAADDRTNKLLVSAMPKQMERIEEVIQILDVPRDQTVGRITRIFSLQYAQAETLARALQEVIIGRRRTRSRWGVQPMRGVMRDATGGGDTEPRISSDPGSNTIIVRASKTQMDEIAELINQLDQPDSAPGDIKIIQLVSNRADRLGPMVLDLVNGAEKSRAKKQRTPAQEVAINWDTRTNTLIVAGSTRQIQIVEQLVSELEATKPSGPRRLNVIRLKNVDPDRAKDILQRLLRQQGSSKKGRSQADKPAEHALALAPVLRSAVTQAMLICSLALQAQAHVDYQQPDPLANWQVPAVNYFEQALAAAPNSSWPAVADPEIEKMLQILRARLAQTRPTLPAAQPALSAQPTTRPAPTAQAQDQEQDNQTPLVAEKIDETKKEKVDKPVQTVASATAAPAPDVGSTLASAPGDLNVESLALEIRGDVEITTLPEQGALVIEADEQDFRIIQQILAMLDLALPAPEIELVSLKNAQAVQLAPMLSKLFTDRVQKGVRPPTFTPEPGTNSLIITATPDLMPEIDRIITELDAVERMPDLEFQPYTLRNANASQVAPKLRQMLTDILRTRGVKEMPFNITAEERTNTIFVQAPRSYTNQISKIIALLDSVPAFTAAEMEIIRLHNADAKAMAEVLKELFDPVTGRKSPQAKAAAETITRLRLRSETGEQLPELDLEKPIKFIADTMTQSILISSSPDNIIAIKGIVTLLDRVPIAHDLKVRIFPLKHAVADDVVDNIENLFKQGKQLTEVPGGRKDVGLPTSVSGKAIVYNVALVADDRSNTIIASGPENSLALVEVMVNQLDKTAPDNFRIYNLAQASVLTVQPILEELFNNRQTPGGKKLEQPAIIADERSNSLIVGANSEDHKALADLLTRMDQPTGISQRVQIFSISKGKAEDIKDLVDEVYAKKRAAGAKGEPISISVIERTNAVVVHAAQGDLSEIADLIKRLDTTPVTKRMRVQVFALKSADAKDLAQTLGDLLGGEGRGSQAKESVIIEYMQKTEQGRQLIKSAIKDEVQIFAEEQTNLLIVLAPEDNLELLAALIDQVESIAPSIEIRMFELLNADAKRMKDTLDELFGIDERRSSGEPGAAIAIGEAAVASLSKLEKEMLSITVDERTNTLLVTGTTTYVDLVQKVIELLDAKEIEQLQTEVISLKNADAGEIEQAISTLIDNRIKLWKDVYGSEGIAPERLLEQEVNIVADEDSRKLIVQASPRYFNQIKEIINELDAPVPQVMIEALLVEVTLSDRLEYGFEIVAQDLPFTEASGGTGIGPKHDVVIGTDVGAAGTGLAGFTFTFNSEDLNMLLRALQAEGKSEILAMPRIMARDNTEAEFTSGSSAPYPSASSINDATGNIVTSVAYKDVGIRLTVTPHINPDGFVHLEIQAEDSSIGTSSVPVGGGLNAPVFPITSATAEITIKDGETIVMGGLIRTITTESETKVPILGDIPILGYLFKSVANIQDKSEILIILTPRVVSGGPEGVEQARQVSEYQRDLMGVLPQEVLTSPLMGNLQIDPSQDQPDAKIDAAEQEQQSETDSTDRRVLFGPPAHLNRP